MQPGLLWAGSDDGYVHVSRDGGATWADVTVPDLPEFAMISVIDPSHHDAGTAYLAATRYKLSDHAPYLFKTSDYGATWTRITDGIEDGHFTRVIREDPARPGLLYAGTEMGAWVSFDDGNVWQPLGEGLPVVPVHDLVVRDGDLAAATHGRSFWILDNVALLRQLTPAAMAGRVHLFQPRPTIRYASRASRAGMFDATTTGRGHDAGRNPPDGVVVHYYLDADPEGEVRLSFLSNGEVIRTFSSVGEADEPQQGFFGRGGGDRTVSTGPGAHRFVWDLRYPPAEVLEDAVFQGRADGPRAPPGSYEVELVVEGRTLRVPFEIRKDPRVEYSQADLEAQFEFLIAVRDKLTETMDVVGRIRELRARGTEAVERAGGGEELESALSGLNDLLYPLEERLVQYRARAGQDLIAQPTGIDSKLARLTSFASMADGPPTQGQRELFQRLSAGVAERAEALARIEANEFAELLRMTGVVFQ